MMTEIVHVAYYVNLHVNGQAHFINILGDNIMPYNHEATFISWRRRHLVLAMYFVEVDQGRIIILQNNLITATDKIILSIMEPPCKKRN